MFFVVCLFLFSYVFSFHLFPRTTGGKDFGIRKPIEFDPKIINTYSENGFIEVDKENEGYMYYLFIPHAGGNISAPVVVWLEGGPGCSDMCGVFAESGPYLLDPQTYDLSPNPHAWSNYYNILYIDNPVGSGWSWIKNSKGYAKDEETIGNELYTLLKEFYKIPKYSYLSHNDLYIWGVSYSGKYIPKLANIIIKNKFEVNLRGIAIGDGLTDPVEQIAVAHTTALANMLIGMEDVDEIVALENKMIDAIKQEEWSTASTISGDIQGAIIQLSGGTNLMDIRRKGMIDFSYIERFMNFDATKKLLGTTNITWDFAMCNSSVKNALFEDMCKSAKQDVIDILESSDRKIKVLLYNGQFDQLISGLGSLDGWIYNMDWKYKKEFQKCKRELWGIVGKVLYGWAKKYENLVTVGVSDAGHVSGYDQPEAILDLVRKFVDGYWD